MQELWWILSSSLYYAIKFHYFDFINVSAFLLHIYLLLHLITFDAKLLRGKFKIIYCSWGTVML